MRFQRVRIPAFGPFTDLEIGFPATGQDLHVIYGENEAGKSSLLRAIRDLLFGIHGQSPDNFLHDYKNLRLIGEIENRAGKRLIFQRRKGNKNTLLDESGNALPDLALQPFLGHIDQSYFSTMFGLGGTELREGAQQLLRGEGEIGSALFSASMGGTPVQRVLDALQVESERIFKGRATVNVSIRPATKRYKELLRQSRDAMIAADLWDELIRELEVQEAAREDLENELSAAEREIAWIQRCEDALPTVGRLNEEKRLLGELPPLPEVSSDFSERAKDARNSVRESNDKVKNLTATIAQLETQLEKCVISPEIMAEESGLDSLHREFGAYQKGKDDLTGLRRKLAGIEPVLRAGMDGLRIKGEFNSLEELRIGSAVRLACEEAAEDLKESRRKHEEYQRGVEQLKQEIADQGEDLDSLPDADLTPLRDALAIASEATEADRTLDSSRKEVDALFRKANADLALLPGLPEDLDSAVRIPIPSLATIRKFAAKFESLKRDTDAASKRLKDEEKSIKLMRAELSRLERRGELPTEDSLKEARDHRNRGWELVLEEWKGTGAQEVYEADLPLEEAFPHAMIRADEIADQLRFDADAVAQAEEKRLQIDAARAKVEEESESIAALEAAKVTSQAAWESEWTESAIQPRTPEEMEEWRENWIALKNVVSDLREAEAALESKADRIKKAVSSLVSALDEPAEKSFSVLFEEARTRVQKGEEAGGARKTLVGQIEKKQKKLVGLKRTAGDLEKRSQAATETWELRRREIGLPDSISPDSGLSLLQERKELLAKFDTWKELSGEASQIEEAISDYEERVRQKAIAFSMESETTEAQEAELWKALQVARDAQIRHDQLRTQIDDGIGELERLNQTAEQANSSLQDLVNLAKLNGADELEPLIANLEKYTSLQGRIGNFRETLGGLARDKGVDEFLAAVQAENGDELPQRKAALQMQTGEKKAKLQQVQGALNDLNRRKDELERAGDAAADFLQQAESVAASLKEDASRYVRLRLATHLLRTQIEKFREENQGPLLEKSGQVFGAITRGAFEGLAAEFTAQDIPVMVGRRPDGSLVPVEGMSEGTRDQLYLALRLAALDRHLEEHEPMPLILDDLLITFDNERTKAILPQLAGLAVRTQVFLFTHHEHLVDLCREVLGEDRFQLHRLDIANAALPK